MQQSRVIFPDKLNPDLPKCKYNDFKKCILPEIQVLFRAIASISEQQ